MITSAQNPKLKLTRTLLTHAKSRRQEGLLVLEGVRLLQDVLEQGFQPEFILHRPEVDLHWLDTSAPVLPVEERLFNELSDTEHSQGILGIFQQPQLELSPSSNLLIVLDGLNDAGNLGTVIRTSAAAGADGVILFPNTVDPYNPKCVRAGMGGHFRIPILNLSWEALKTQFSDWQHVGTVVDDIAQPYTANIWQTPTVLVIGSEAHGISDQTRQIINQTVYIPMSNGVESLNSSIAAAILLFEIKRQRGG